MKKTYRRTTRSKIVSEMVSALVLMIWLVVIAYWLPLVWLVEVLAIGFLVLLFLGILLDHFFDDTFGETLIVSEECVEYYRWIFGIKVPWDRFKRIGYFWFREGLFIGYGYITSVSSIFPDNNWTVYGGFPAYMFVPLSSFADHWRSSDLGEQIKRYAPQLFV